jgi:hypothetical protein
MMAVLGFILCCLVLIQFSIISLTMFALCTGPFTIGGAVQPWYVRTISAVSPFALGYFWYVLFSQYAPFEVIFK